MAKKIKYKIETLPDFPGIFHLFRQDEDTIELWINIESSYSLSELIECAANDANPPKQDIPVVIWSSEIEVKK